MPADITQHSGGSAGPPVSLPPPERREAQKQAVSTHKEAGRQFIWVRRIDLIPSGLWAPALRVDTRAPGFGWGRVEVGKAAFATQGEKSANPQQHVAPPNLPSPLGNHARQSGAFQALNRHATEFTACKEAAAANARAASTQLSSPSHRIWRCLFFPLLARAPANVSNNQGPERRKPARMHEFGKC